MRIVTRYLFLATALLPAVAVAQLQASVLSARAAGRILDQATWGPTPAATAELEALGLKEWFNRQVAAPASTYPDQPILNPTTGKTNYNLAPVQVRFFRNALTGPDQLRQRVAFALSEIWVVSHVELLSAYAFPPYMRILQADAFGNYETLMKDVSLNPAMGQYLNMVNNAKGSATTSPNENYAREIMQLFTIGLTQLHENGTPVLDKDHVPIPTYTQNDVTNLARAFTGWVYGTPSGVASHGVNPPYYLTPMIPDEERHDTTAKTVLGEKIPAGGSAEQDLEEALHILFMNSSMPAFVSQQLIQHLVTSNPSPEYVERVAHVFKDNGVGIRGDLKAVIYAILSDSEARAADEAGSETSSTFGHMREPALFVANLLRGLDASLAPDSTIYNVCANLGQNVLNAPSVFSYFAPGYRATDGLLAPEFQLYSTQTAATRVNDVNSAVYNGEFDPGTKFDISAFTTVAGISNQALIELIGTRFFHEDMSKDLKTAITDALRPLTAASDKAKAALYVALSSGEYQIIH